MWTAAGLLSACSLDLIVLFVLSLSERRNAIGRNPKSTFSLSTYFQEGPPGSRELDGWTLFTEDSSRLPAVRDVWLLFPCFICCRGVSP